MIICDQQREDNYQEYVRLLQDPIYLDVVYDVESGGYSAVHRGHNFDKQIGVSGEQRGQYELNAIKVLRQNGHCIILDDESTAPGMKKCDGFLDGTPFEIKSIESIGRWTIRTKIANSVKQGAEIVVLYFPDSSILSIEKVQEGWQDYMTYTQNKDYNPDIQLFCVSKGRIIRIKKPSW